MTEGQADTESNNQFRTDTKRPNNRSNNSSTTITPTPSRMASQLPSPPETLTESLANSQSTLGSSTDDDAPASRPSTPQRGRLDPRFPSTLGPGRVPLHRRGTSKTYERMEDLLREAGYKETRVFTPETERAEAEAEERNERTLRRAASVRSGVDAVVGFISGLVSRAPSVVADGRVGRPADASGSKVVAMPQQEYSPPPSPLANKRVIHLPRSSIYTHSRPSSPSSLNPNMSTESLNLSPRASSSHRLPRSANATPRPLHQDPYTQSPTRPSRLRPQPSFSSNSAHVPQTYAQASKARLYLRHMASAPSIKPAHHSSLNTSLQRHSSSRYATRGNKRSMTLDDNDLHTERRGNGEGEEDHSAAPPLPRTWLESVARAVLFGGTGAHMGGPSTISPSASSRSPSQSHSQSRSPISRSRLDVLRQSPFSSTSALSDRTNVPRQMKSHPPPLLCAQVAAYRAPSESRVSRTRVVCHSAPGSRSGSRVRVPAEWGLQVADMGRGKRSRGKPAPPRNQKDKGKPKGKDGMPTLANTHAHDDDEWGQPGGDEGMYTSGSSSEDDDEGELDLARLLVPSKRQNSIRSLRKHLHTPSPRQRLLALPYQRANGNGTRSSAGSMSRRGRGQGRARDDDGDEDWHSVAAGWDRDGIKAKVAGGLDEGIFFGGDGAAGPRKRTGIPGTWAQRNVEA